MKRFSFILVLGLLSSIDGMAWTQRGHELLTATAAKILESQPKFAFLKNYEFDLGYYANVPDIVWRALPPPAGRQEPPQHFIDWTKDLETVFQSPKNLPVDFYEYKRKMGDKFSLRNGVSPYRIHGILGRCKQLVSHLTKETQGLLLECLGLVSHYTGDLGMPLHVSENYDGQLTGQDGIHAFFETKLVNELDPEVKIDVIKLARENFSKSEMAKLNSDAAVRWLIADSYTHIPELLAIDKSIGRKDIDLAKEKFKGMIENGLMQGAILTAVVWQDILAPLKNFDEKKFNHFNSRPSYLTPGKE